MSTPYTFVPDLLKEVQVPENGTLSRTLYSDDKIKVVIFGFAAGQELSAHTAPMPATLYFVQGEAEVTLGEDKMNASAGAFVYMAPKLTHGIMAKTPTIMLLTMVKSATVA